MTLKSYVRVLPRDAFNEGNLLKCLGRLFLLCDDAPKRKSCQLVHVYDDQPFRIEQDDATGAITATNVHMVLGGEIVYFWRPLNSRQSWPLYIEINNETIQVFVDDIPEGILTGDFKELIGYGNRS